MDEFPEGNLPAPKPRKNMFEYSLSLADWNLLTPRVTDPQEIFNIAHDYFSHCYDKRLVPTVTGLSIRLGYKKNELLDIRKGQTAQAKAINLAVSLIVEMVERELLTSKAGQVGLLFWLKNIDEWVDKTEVQTSKKTMKEFLQELKQTRPVEAYEDQERIEGSIVEEE